MFQLLSIIALKFSIYLYNVKKYAQQYIKNINKNIFNNFLIAKSRRTRTHLFQKLPSPVPAPAPAPAPESRNAPVLHRLETLCRQAYGVEQYKKLGIYTYAAIISLILVCIPISTLWMFTDKLLILIGQDSTISHIAHKYCVCLIPNLFS